MKRSSLALYQGNGFTIQGPRRFRKDILRVGRWKHPVTGQDVEITQARIEALAVATEKYRDTMDRKAIPFPDGHTFDAKKNLGYWTSFSVEGDRLVGTVEVTDDEAARKIEQGSIRSVSARIDPDVRDTQGNVFVEAMTHVCATPIPVLDGQLDFVKLSREADPVDLIIPTHLTGMSPEDERKEIRMLTKIALALGLAEAATEEQVLVALKKQGEDMKSLKDGQTALAAQLEKEHGLKLDGNKVVKLSAPPPVDEAPEVKALREEVANLKKAQALSRQQEMEKLVSSFVEAKQLPPAGKTIADRMLARIREAQGLMLSNPGDALKRFSEAMEANNKDLIELMGTLPKLGEIQLSQLSGEQIDEQKKIDKAAKGKASEVLARVTGTDGDQE